MVMRSPILVISAWLLFVSGFSPGHAGNLDRSTNGQDVTVTIASPFSELPPGGGVPFRVNIRNDHSTVGTWHLTFQGSTNTATTGATTLEQDMTVAGNSTGSFDVFAPLPVVSAEVGGTNLYVGVTGPGFDHSVMNQFFAFFNTNYAKSRCPYTLIGNETLGSSGVGPLEKYYADLGQEFYGSAVDADKLPSDWRGYSGVAVFFLKDTEWLSLNSTQREAICEYVAQGGHLNLFTSKPDTETPDLHLPGSDGQPGPYGFGSITLSSTATFPPETGILNSAIESHLKDSAKTVDQNFSTWALRQMLGTIEVSGTFIISFVILFGALVGPINLFMFARGKKRFRLFWTTPLISISASLALITGILITDGIGGSGREMIAIYSLPELNREAVIQEQVSRTAVLFSNRWRTDQNYLITPISEQALADATDTSGGRVYRGRGNLSDSPDTYLLKGNQYSGNWFRSRTVSGQYLQAVRPSRSSLTVLNPKATGSPEQAPVVLSSFSEVLAQVFIRDQQGTYWTCDNLEPGRKKSCTQSTDAAFTQFWTKACEHAGGKLRPLLSTAAGRNGCFYATGTPSGNEGLTTLSEIHWQTTNCVYLGPLVASPTSETGP